jgi:hypothetical protein
MTGNLIAGEPPLTALTFFQQQTTGKLVCEVPNCGFDFKEPYGQWDQLRSGRSPDTASESASQKIPPNNRSPNCSNPELATNNAP